MTKFLKDINLKGKFALITGATTGIGRSTAVAMHQVGASIIAIGRNKSELNSLKKKLRTRIQCIECDIRDYNKISKIIKNIKKIEVNEIQNEMLKNFYNDSKKVSNEKVKKSFNYKFKFPSYVEGLNYIRDNFI